MFIIRVMEKIENIRHSLAHLLAASVLQKFPQAKLGIGPTIENGFYYDFLLPRPLTPDDLKEFEKSIRDLIKKELPFSGKKISSLEAKKNFCDQPFKLELIKDFVKEKKILTIYSILNPKASRLEPKAYFVDLCRGGHVKNTREINPDAFKLMSIAGAYWRGNEKNKMLTRVYGLAFENKKELENYLANLEEAKKRDHRKLGADLDLFVFSDLVGGGLPLWTPKGTLLRDLLDDFVWQLRKERGYEKVDIPHITKKDLYEKSGHWEKFKDALFQIKTREGRTMVLKPMNCPHHIQIFDRKKWSYREMPQRYASTTKVYRDEQSGELAGLARVLSITQDDAHVFCRKSQIEAELWKVWDIVEKFYGAFGFVLEVRLSLRDPKKPKEYLGAPKTWLEAENVLRKLAEKRKAKVTEVLGEAAFYGPKIDFMAKDSLGRKSQVATIQLDMNMPASFNLSCVNEKGEEERIMMIHAAIMGSIERFLSLLIEHFAGAFPVWLAPVQVAILPISDKQNKYAQEVYSRLFENGIRVEISDSNSTIGKKIREAQLMKIPYMLIVGEKEEKSGMVSVRARSGKDFGEVNPVRSLARPPKTDESLPASRQTKDLGEATSNGIKLVKFIGDITNEIKNKKI